MPNNDMMRGYQSYNQGFSPMQTPAPSALASSLPMVNAGLGAAGLLASLYGNYKANEIAEQNYREQKREFEAQRKMEEERIKREKENERMQQLYAAANRVDQGDDRLLSRYRDYYKGIGL